MITTINPQYIANVTKRFTESVKSNIEIVDTGTRYMSYGEVRPYVRFKVDGAEFTAVMYHFEKDNPDNNWFLFTYDEVGQYLITDNIAIEFDNVLLVAFAYAQGMHMVLSENLMDSLRSEQQHPDMYMDIETPSDEEIRMSISIPENPNHDEDTAPSEP